MRTFALQRNVVLGLTFCLPVHENVIKTCSNHNENYIGYRAK